MATYFFKATNASGKIETGTVEVGSKQKALEKLEKMGLFPLSVSDKKLSGDFDLRKFDLDQFLPSRRVSQKNVLEFTDKLSTLLRSGLPLAKALKLLIDTTSHEPTREVIQKVLKDVSAGQSFADALSHHPKAFERLYINMVRTGEAAGVLERVLDEVRSYMQTRQEMRAFLISSMIYPAILGLTGIGTVAVLVFFVLPRFQGIFDQLGQELPFITRLMVDITTFLTTYKLWMALAVVTAVVAFTRWVSSAEGRLKWDTLKLKLPLVGPIFTEIEVNRFSRAMGILLTSSVSLLDALSIAKDITENMVFRNAMDPITKGVKKGEGMSKPMNEAKVFPRMAIQLVTVGEETGTLGSMFIKISEIYQKNMEQTIKRVLAAFEPAMIFVMFIIVGFIVAAMLMAVTSLSTVDF